MDLSGQTMISTRTLPESPENSDASGRALHSQQRLYAFDMGREEVLRSSRRDRRPGGSGRSRHGHLCVRGRLIASRA